MSHGGLVGVMPGVKRVPPCGMCMMGRFFVMSALMMLSCFAVVTRGMRMMLCRLLMVLGCFLGHGVFPLFGGPHYSHGQQRNAHIREIVPYKQALFPVTTMQTRHLRVENLRVGWSAQRRWATSALVRIPDSSRTSREV
jgi:hypothetical protein